MVILMSWDRVREDFEILTEITYLNTASVGLLPKKSRERVLEWLNERGYGNLYWMRWYEESKRVKELFAKLINASPEEISLVENTSMGLNLVANSIKWERGDNIVINDMEFPANVFPWQVQARKHGLEIRVVRSKNGVLDINDYQRLTDEHTKVIAVSWVEFSNGFVHDLKALSEIAHDVGAFLVVDGIQGVGALKLDVKKSGVDFLVCGGHKWLLGLSGAGLMYIKKEVLDELDISFGGWLADKNPSDFTYREYKPAEDARRFELGSPSFIGYYALSASLEYILSLGIDAIEKRDLELASYLIERMGIIAGVASPLKDGEPLSPIISLEIPNANEVAKVLWEKSGIRVSARLGRIRVSPHFYNNEEDIDKLYYELKRIL